MAQIEAYLLIFLTVLVGHVKSKLCYSGSNDAVYCQHDCCGASGYQYCCNTDSDTIIGYTVYGVGAIVGIVIGSLVGLGLLIGAIACCCCCHQRRHATNGQVLQPHTNLGFSVTATTNGTQMSMTQLPPGMYAPSYPTTPQMAAGYMQCMPDTMNKLYDAPPSMNDPYGAPPPAYDNVVRS